MLSHTFELSYKEDGFQFLEPDLVLVVRFILEVDFFLTISRSLMNPFIIFPSTNRSMTFWLSSGIVLSPCPIDEIGPLLLV